MILQKQSRKLVLRRMLKECAVALKYFSYCPLKSHWPCSLKSPGNVADDVFHFPRAFGERHVRLQVQGGVGTLQLFDEGRIEQRLSAGQRYRVDVLLCGDEVQHGRRRERVRHFLELARPGRRLDVTALVVLPVPRRVAVDAVEVALREPEEQLPVPDIGPFALDAHEDLPDRRLHVNTPRGRDLRMSRWMSACSEA